MTRRSARGVTLIELMVTVAVATVMLMVAVPSLQSFVRGTQLRTTASDLGTTLQFARSEAIKRGWPVTVCKSSSTQAANPSCDNNATWQQGWLVFVDHNQDGALTTVPSASFPADTALRVGTPAATTVVISGGASFPNHVIFRPSGSPLGHNSADAGQFTFCLSPLSRSLNLSRTGRSQISSGSCT